MVLDGSRRAVQPGEDAGGSGAADVAAGDDADEEDDEDDEDEPSSMYTRGAGYNAEDEKYAQEHPDDKEEYESLMRYLAKKKGAT